MNSGKKEKKLKTRVLSFIGILAGCLMIFAGYWIMQQMLEKRQNKLLSQNGSLSTSKEDLADAEEEESRSKLTEDELEDILLGDYIAVDIVPHEPYGWQMTMQEAMETGQTWVESFCTAYDFPEEGSILQFEEMSAQLCTREMGKEDYVNESIVSGYGTGSAEIRAWMSDMDWGERLAESMYGYWDISFSANGINVNLQINAVSGQVLQVRIETDPYETDEYFDAMEKLSELKILENFVDSFGFGSGYQTEGTDNRYEMTYPGQFVFFAEKTVYPEEEDLQWDEYIGCSFVMGAETDRIQEEE